MILEPGVYDDDDTVLVDVSGFEFDLVFVICDSCRVWIFVWGVVLWFFCCVTNCACVGV